MNPETTKLPIKGDDARAMLLSEDERMRIAVAEEYRIEIRRQLENPNEESKDGREFFKEKLLAPALILLLSVTASGIGIPKIIEISDRGRRATEARANLLQEIVQESAEMQAAIDARAEALDAFAAEGAEINALLGEFALKRDLGEMTPEEFARQDGLIENDRKRVSDRLDVSTEQYIQQRREFLPWLERTRMKIETSYTPSNERANAEESLARLKSSFDESDSWLRSRIDENERATAAQIGQVKKLRQAFRARTLGGEEYRREVEAVLDRLRNRARLPGRVAPLNGDAMREVLEFVREAEPLA